MYALAFTVSEMSNQEKQGVKIEVCLCSPKKKKNQTWITVRFLFDVEHAGSSIEKRVGHKCTVGRLVLVLPLLVTHVARVGAVEEEKTCHWHGVLVHIWCFHQKYQSFFIYSKIAQRILINKLTMSKNMFVIKHLLIVTGKISDLLYIQW